MKRNIILIIFLISLNTTCFSQKQFNQDDYKKFVGQWAPVSDSIHVRKYGWSPTDYNILLNGVKFEITVTTQSLQGTLISKETLRLEIGEGLRPDLFVMISTDTLLNISFGGNDFSVDKYFRVKK